MKNRILYYLLFAMTILLMAGTSCSDTDDTEMSVNCSIEDFILTPLDNSALQPIPPLEGEAILKDALVLELKLLKGLGKRSYEGVGSMNNILIDPIQSLKIIDNTSFATGVPAGTDVSSYFKVKGYQENDLEDFRIERLPHVPLLLTLLSEPSVGLHQFELTVIFDSGMQISKQVDVELK